MLLILPDEPIHNATSGMITFFIKIHKLLPRTEQNDKVHFDLTLSTSIYDKMVIVRSQHEVNQKRIRRLMRQMEFEIIYSKL